MTVYLNGRFLPEEEACISVFDRGFLYGDSLFETILIRRGAPIWWSEHFTRFRQGAEALNIPLAGSEKELLSVLQELVRQNQLPTGVLRMTLSRGRGRRGYSPRGAGQPTFVMSLHPAEPPPVETPVQWRLVTSALRLTAQDPLGQIKHGSKLLHVLARAEAEERGGDEALLLNTQGEAAECASGNLFWVEQQALFTPPLASPALRGITRGKIIELARQHGWEITEQSGPLRRIREADGVFVTLTSLGVVEAVSLDGTELHRAALTSTLHRAYQALVQSCE